MKKFFIYLVLVLMMLVTPSVLRAEVFFRACNMIGIAYYGNCSGGSPPPPTCSNSLDFSQACNSQYIPMVL